MSDSANDWKLKLKYGKLLTPFHHYTVIAEGQVNGELQDGYNCPQGNAFMGMKCWASSTDEAADMITYISNNIGFTLTGDIQIFVTDPVNAPGEKPFGYDINFTPFGEQ